MNGTALAVNLRIILYIRNNGRIVAAIAMAGFEFLIQKKGKAQLENFSLAASMLIAMAAAVVLSLVL